MKNLSVCSEPVVPHPSFVLNFVTILTIRLSRHYATCAPTIGPRVGLVFQTALWALKCHLRHCRRREMIYGRSSLGRLWRQVALGEIIHGEASTSHGQPFCPREVIWCECQKIASSSSHQPLWVARLLCLRPARYVFICFVLASYRGLPHIPDKSTAIHFSFTRPER